MMRLAPGRLAAVLVLAFVLGLLVAGTPVPWAENSAAPPPTQILLTWAGNPANSISIQWRTSPSVTSGAAAYVRRADSVDTASVPWKFVYADCRTIAQAMNWHTARLAGLQPSTEYFYVVGDGRREGWSEPRLFRTGPATPERFCFMYMGDAQKMIHCFEQVLELEPTNGAGHYHMAVGLHSLGNTKKARMHLATAVGLGHSPDPAFVKALEQEESPSPVHVLEVGPDPEGQGDEIKKN